MIVRLLLSEWLGYDACCLYARLRSSRSREREEEKRGEGLDTCTTRWCSQKRFGKPAAFDIRPQSPPSDYATKPISFERKETPTCAKLETQVDMTMYFYRSSDLGSTHTCAKDRRRARRTDMHAWESLAICEALCVS